MFHQTKASGRSILPMNLNTLKDYRQEVYGCFGQAKDALFNTVDALLTEDRARSFPELSLSPYFERRWPSLYEGLEDGKIDQKRLQKGFARFLPQSYVQDLVWVGIDVSGIARPHARTSADRSALYVHNLPECKKPITFGWQFSTSVVLPASPSSWTYVLDQQRDGGAGRLCAIAATDSSVASQHGHRSGPRIQLDVVVVPVQRLAHQGNTGASQRQSLLLSGRSPSHGETRSTAQGWGQIAARRSDKPWQS
jgi:hypothetical protein